jgi:hypothetical protein
MMITTTSVSGSVYSAKNETLLGYAAVSESVKPVICFSYGYSGNFMISHCVCIFKMDLMCVHVYMPDVYAYKCVSV